MLKDKPRIVASIEARMGSSRLPGKVLSDIQGKPALTRLLNRLSKSKHIDDFVLATTTNEKDAVLVEWANDIGVSVHRGSEEDVLSRVVDAHVAMSSEIVVEITGDCILTDHEIIDMGIETFFYNRCDVVTNVKSDSYPMGIDVQVFRRKDLEWVAKNIFDPKVREHVSLYFYEHPERYNVHHLVAPLRWRGPTYRFQLDYFEDHQFINEIYRQLEPIYGETFGLEEIMQLLRKQPELVNINIHCAEKVAR